MKRILLITNPDAIRRADKAAAVFAYASKRDWDVSTVSSGDGMRPGEISRTLRPDGIIIEGLHRLTRADRRLFERVPTVYLDAGVEDARYAVSSDSGEIARLALTELKHPRPASILFASSTPGRLWSIEREQAAERLCRTAGMTLTSAHGNFSAALERLPKPIGVFAVHDNTALEIYAAARAMRLGIPRDIRVVSVGNNPVYAANLRPSLTSIEIDSYRAGAAAAELLDRLLCGEPVKETHIRIRPVGLVRRASSVAVSTNRGIGAALTIIRERACTGLTVDDVAKSMAMSRRSAENAFSRETGQTIYEKILEKRFEEVERLLHAPKIPLGEIAGHCGWKSSAHLARAFRQRYGQTMSTWREHAEAAAAKSVAEDQRARTRVRKPARTLYETVGSNT